MSYPSALVELALLLCGTYGAVRATSELGIGKSTLYRWKNTYSTAWMPHYRKGIDGRPDRWNEVASDLYARCERAGLHMRSPLLGDSIANHKPEFAALDSREQTLAHRCVESMSLCHASENISERMIRAKREIDDNYASKQSIKRLGDLVGLSRIRFIKEFKAAFGVSPYRYLLSVRFRRALELLEHSDTSFAVVASTTGFGTAASMQYAFKRFSGVTPARLMNTIAPQCISDGAQSRVVNA